MVDEIIAGIAGALIGAFGEGVAVYADRVGQGITLPCFSVNLISRESRPMPGRRRRHTLPFDVMYFPVDGENRTEIWQVEGRMREALGQVRAGGGMIGGVRMKSEQADGILHFYVQYNYFSIEPDDTERMGVYRGVTAVKGGKSQAV